MKIVFLDVKTIGEDIDLSGFDRLGEVVKYDFSTSEEVPERVQDADVIILNKVQVNEQTIGKAENLKLVCVTATGTNNLDKEYLEKRGVAWRNVAGYSTETVAQHTFAMLLYLLEKIRYYDDYVKEDQWQNVGDHRSGNNWTESCGYRKSIWSTDYLLLCIRAFGAGRLRTGRSGYIACKI